MNSTARVQISRNCPAAASEQRHEQRPDQQHRGVVAGEAALGAVLDFPHAFPVREVVAEVDGLVHQHGQAGVLPVQVVGDLRVEHADHHQDQQGHDEAEGQPPYLVRRQQPVAANQQAEQDHPDHRVERSGTEQAPEFQPGFVEGEGAVELVEEPEVEAVHQLAGGAPEPQDQQQERQKMTDGELAPLPGRLERRGIIHKIVSPYRRRVGVRLSRSALL